MDYPRGMVDVPEHPTWPEYPYQDRDRITISLLECNRFTLGAFERPIRLIVEASTTASVRPEACDPDPETRPASVALGFIASMGTNDSEVAEVLQRDYGLPVYLADIDVTVDNSDGTSSQVWRWSSRGGPMSELRTPVDSLPRQDGRSLYWRWFWFNETATSAIDLHWEFEGPFFDEPLHAAIALQQAATRVSYGKMEEPMLLADQPTYVGNGEYQTNVNWTGFITKFTDHDCSAEVA